MLVTSRILVNTSARLSLESTLTGMHFAFLPRRPAASPGSSPLKLRGGPYRQGAARACISMSPPCRTCPPGSCRNCRQSSPDACAAAFACCLSAAFPFPAGFRAGSLGVPFFPLGLGYGTPTSEKLSAMCFHFLVTCTEGILPSFSSRG